MKSLIFFLVFLFIVLSNDWQVRAQDKIDSSNPKPASIAQPQMLKPLPADLIAFFAGKWTGEGKFASGKSIKADVEFSPQLDNQWLLYSHQDQAPNKYKALGMWGFERSSGKFLMVVQDNFGAARQFQSEGGWKNGKLVFIREATPAVPSLERFTFEKQSNETFKMTYEVSKDASEWRLVDYLIFARKKD